MSSVDTEGAESAADDAGSEPMASVQCRACGASYNAQRPVTRRCRFCGAKGTKTLFDTPVDEADEQLPSEYWAC